MKRLAVVCMVAAMLGGCRSASKHGCTSCGGGHASAKHGPAKYGPFAEPGYMCEDGACYANSGPPMKPSKGKAKTASHMPPEIMQAAHWGGSCSAGNCPPGGAAVNAYGNMMTLAPGSPMGPSGVGAGAPPGAVAAVGALTGGMADGMPGGVSSQRTSIRFAAPNDMRIAWFGSSMAGQPGYDANQLKVPARYNFLQGAIYRLRLSNIPNQGDLVVYPTLEVVPANAKTAVFLAHSAVPIAFTDEDFAQIKAGNYLVKVIYLPDPQFQDLATAGPSEIISTRLEPGADPIAEACRRGSILAVVRVGNIDLEAPNTPAMDGSNPMMDGGLPAGSTPAPARMMMESGAIKPVTYMKK